MTDLFTPEQKAFIERAAHGQAEWMRQNYEHFARDLQEFFAHTRVGGADTDVLQTLEALLAKLNAYRSLFSGWHARPALPGLPEELVRAGKDFTAGIVSEIEGLIARWEPMRAELERKIAEERQAIWLKKLEGEIHLGETLGQLYEKRWRHQLQKFGIF